MSFLIDIVIATAALLAAAYCMLLSRRLRALTRLDGDVGKAIAVLSHQVDELTKALHAAEQSNNRANTALDQQIERADATARRLELMMAAHQASPSDATAKTNLSAAAPRTMAEPDSMTEEFAPFSRAASRNGTETRARVLRQRDTMSVSR